MTEDIYLKLRVVVHYQKGKTIPVGEVILQFFDKVMPLFNLEFSKCSYSRALAPACGALVDLEALYKTTCNHNSVGFTDVSLIAVLYMYCILEK